MQMLQEPHLLEYLQRWVVSKDAISKARCIVGCPNNIKINHAFDSVIRKYED